MKNSQSLPKPKLPGSPRTRVGESVAVPGLGNSRSSLRYVIPGIKPEKPTKLPPAQHWKP